MRFVISIEQKHPLISMIEKEYQTVPLHIHSSDSGSFVDLFLQVNGNRQIDNIISNFSTVALGDLRVVRVRAEEVESASSTIDQVLAVKSVLPAGLYLTGNKIMACFRFHHSEIKSISEIANRIVKLKNHITVKDLGPDPGGIAAIEEMNLRINLAVVSYDTFSAPSDAGHVPNLIYDAKYSTFTGNETGSLVLYDTSSSERSIGSVISEEDGIYFTTISSPFFREVWAAANEMHIPRASIIVRPIPGGLRTFSFIPTTLVGEYLTVLFDAAEKFPERQFCLATVRAYDKTIWDWI